MKRTTTTKTAPPKTATKTARTHAKTRRGARAKVTTRARTATPADWRSKIDWAAAGRKAFATRLRNAAAKAKATKGAAKATKLPLARQDVAIAPPVTS